jgi:hypothetical protein
MLALWVLMPKTTMHKDNGFVLGKNDIRIARKIFAVQTKTKSCGMQQGANR